MFKRILDAVQGELSGGAALEQVAAISQFHRIQASPGFRAAAEHCRRYLEAEGVQARVHSYPAKMGESYWGKDLFQEWDASAATLYLINVDGEDEKLADYRDSKTSLIQRSAPFHGETELVVLEDGEEESDYEGLDVTDSVVLTKGNVARVYELAVAKRNAAGIIYDGMRSMPPVAEAMDLPDALQYTSFWWGIGDKPCFGFVLTPRRGSKLRQKAAECANTPLRFRAHVDSRLYDGSLEVVSALIPGETEEEVLLTAHLCHPQYSANDNASGSAVALETARTLSSLILQGRLPQPKRSIRFLWVPEMAGTYCYLAEHEEDITKMIAGLNLDMVGENQELCGASFLIETPPMSMPSFAPTLTVRIREDLVSETSSHSGLGGYALFRHAVTPFSGGSDHYILSDPTVGIPSPMIIQYPDKFWHTSEDTLDKVDRSMLGRIGVLAATYLYFIASAGASEASWLGHEMLARYKGDVAKSLQQIVSEAMVEESAQGVADLRRRLQLRAQFALHHATDAFASLGRLSPDISVLVADLKQDAEAATARELEHASQAIAARTAVVGIDRLPEPSPPAQDEWTERASRLVPRRILRGPVSVGGPRMNRLSEDEREAWHQLRREHGKTPRAFTVVALYWTDGARSLADIADLTQLETGVRDTELLLEYFQLLARMELIELSVRE